MTWVDGVVLAVLAVSAVVAFSRGMVREVLGVGAWIGAVLAALAAREPVSRFFDTMVDQPWVAEALAAAGVFIVVLIALKLIIGAIANRVQDSVLGGVDRALGLVFGLVRGAFLVVLAYILGGMLLPATERWPEAVHRARFLPIVVDGANWLVAQLPPDIRPRVAIPQAQPGPNQDDLMRPPARSRT